jgi:hypothetical protein
MALDGLESELLPVIREPTGTSSAGWPYLSRAAWVRLRDWVPHVLSDGLRVWEAVERLRAAAPGHEPALGVVLQVVRTAAITAPPDLWLLRHVLGALARTGWRDRLAVGVSHPPPDLVPDLTLLLARGYLVRGSTGLRHAEEPTAARVWSEVGPLPVDRPTDLSRRFAAAFAGDRSEDALLLEILRDPVPAAVHRAPAWVATPEDLELGYRLVPIVLGLRVADRIAPSLDRGHLALDGVLPELVERVGATLRSAGWVGEGTELTAIGRRGLERGPGPFGIIEAYHPYLAQLPQIWERGRGGVHVERAANVAASQDANRATFAAANDALDRFCADTGFRYRVFVEHAVGRGEALRQRFARSGPGLVYVGADLEQAAIGAARAEVAAGRLPASLAFVQADIGEPSGLVRALRDAGHDPEGAVMLVGNGFHEVRGASDERMVEVFRGYEQAGFVLLFTEETGLSVDDLLETAWNTYHAGFRYAHERSGQGLRPATPSPVPGLGPPLPLSWLECAVRAGYVRAERYCSRSRTIYPYPPANGHNPSVSANWFFVPARLARALGV